MLASSVAVRRAAIAAVGGLPFHLGAAAGYGAARAAASTLFHWFLINLLILETTDLSRLASKDSDVIKMDKKGSMHLHAREHLTSHLPARIGVFLQAENSAGV